jgi:hypothetical protein
MTKKCLYLILLMAFSYTTMAQNKEEAGVNAAVELLRKNMIDPDKAMLQKITSEQLSYGHSSGTIEDQATFIETLVSGKSDFVTIDLTDQTVSVSGNTAIVRHNLSATTNDGGNPGTVKLHIMTVWQKQKGQWKMLARQAVKLPK